MKKILLSFLIFVWLICGYSLVFSDFSNSKLSVKKSFINSTNIYLDSLNLNSILVSFTSNKDLKGYNIFSNCKVQSNYLKEIKNEYFFSIKYIDKNCSNPNIVLVSSTWKTIPNTFINFKLIKESDLYKILIDYSNQDLLLLSNKLEAKVNDYYIFSKYISWYSEKSFMFLFKNRSYKELVYNLDLVNDIISNRKNKYISPVLNYNISNKYSKLPNTWRPYRQSYTDWIHHWWDVDAPYWTKVIALDKAIVVRVVDGFTKKDFWKIKKWEWLSYNDELINLDILRWNQVWIKTMKWEVIFYSHLSKIFSNIKPWVILDKWDSIWEIGISGIPWNNYTDYHLHFAIHKNPYFKYKYWNYSYIDYMAWDWKFKWQSREYILNNTKKVFQ